MKKDIVYIYKDTDLKFFDDPELRNKVSRICLSGSNKISDDDNNLKAAGIIIEVLSKLTNAPQKLQVGRLDAYHNNIFISELQSQTIPFQQFGPKNIESKSLLRKLTKFISLDYKESWIFFNPPDWNSLKSLIAKYWFCRGGIWIILQSDKEIDLSEWKQIKESLNYNINDFMEKDIVNFDLLLRIIDDDQIDFFFKKDKLTAFQKILEEVMTAHNITLLDEPQFA